MSIFHRCPDGHIELLDGVNEPGRYPYPANIMCGQYDPGELNVAKYTTLPHGEIRFHAAHELRRSTFTVTYKYINLRKQSSSYLVNGELNSSSGFHNYVP